MSDRILVMRQGVVAGQLSPESSEADIMFLATGERDIAVGAGASSAEPGS
jgi:hypothetical protein